MLKSKFIRIVVDEKSKGLRRAAECALRSLPARALSCLSSGVQYEISISIISAPRMKRLNANYRGKNRPTDVLAFAALEGKSPKLPVRSIGDVVICLDVAKKQAQAYGTSLKEELNRLAVHGVLHLFGYDHEKSRAEEKRMFALQERILKKLQQIRLASDASVVVGSRCRTHLRN